MKNASQSIFFYVCINWFIKSYFSYFMFFLYILQLKSVKVPFRLAYAHVKNYEDILIYKETFTWKNEWCIHVSSSIYNTKNTITWKQRVLKLKAMDVRLMRIELIKYGTYLAKIHLFNVNNRSNRKWCEICSKLTTKWPGQRHWRRSGGFIVNFKHISHLFLGFLSLILNK